MIIRVDKCKTFGVVKIGSQCKQYLPKLFLNNELVPQIKLEESFTYLGRHFNYAMDDAEHKSHVQERTNEILQDTQGTKSRFISHTCYHKFLGI